MLFCIDIKLAILLRELRVFRNKMLRKILKVKTDEERRMKKAAQWRSS
jgi:hypothetical protein